MRAVHSHWPSAQWWRVGAWVVQVAREVAGSAIERARRDWQVARRCLPVWGSRSTHRWVRGRLADWSCALSVLTGPVHVKVVRGCVGGPGRAQSCWKWIRARESLLASSAHVFAIAGSRGEHGWVRGRPADWSCCSPLSLAQRTMVARGCAGGPRLAQVAASGFERARPCWQVALIFASAWSRGKPGGVRGGLQTGRVRTACLWPSACYGGALVRGWSRSRAKLLEVDPSARVLAGK